MNVNKLAEKIINETNRKDYQHVVYEVVDYLYLNNYLGDRQQIKDMIDAEIELYEGIIKSTEDKPTKMAFEGSVLALNKIRDKIEIT